MIRYSAVEPISQRTIRTLFRSQLSHVIPSLTETIAKHQGGTFNEQERQAMFAAGYRPSDEQLLSVYATARVEGLLEVYCSFGRRWRTRFNQLKAKLFAKRQPIASLPDIEFGILVVHDAAHNIRYWRCPITCEWSMSLEEAKQKQQAWIAKQTALGFGADRKARIIHARRTYWVDSDCHSCYIGDTEVKRHSSRVYLIKPLTLKDKSGNTRTLSGQQSCCLIENITLLPDKNHILRLRSCVIDTEPFEVFSSELAMNYRGIVRKGE